MTVNDIAQHSDDMKPRAEKVTVFVTRTSPLWHGGAAVPASQRAFQVPGGHGGSR